MGVCFSVVVVFLTYVTLNEGKLHQKLTFVRKFLFLII